jgi:hypothetical protein
MSREFDLRNGSGKPKVYQIRIKGHLDSEWMDSFGALNIGLQGDGDTLLTFEVVDQAALHGLLKRVRDSGMTLVSVCPVKPDLPDVKEV